MQKEKEKPVSTLAEDVGFEVYSQVPIEGFGLQLMEAMGFTADRGIGRSNRGGMQEPLVLKARPKGLGLGANPEGFKEDEGMRLEVGQRISVINGAHKDLSGRIIKINPEE